MASEWPLLIKKRNDLELKSQIERIASSEGPKIREIMKLVEEEAEKAFKNGHRKNACLVYNPMLKEIIALEGDRTHREPHSLSHAVMNCLQKCSEVLKTSPPQAQMEKEQTLGDKKLAKDRLPELDEDLSSLGHEQYYLCSNLHVFTYQEPCVMCAMALVHSRIERLIYMAPRNDHKKTEKIGSQSLKKSPNDFQTHSQGHPNGWGGCNEKVAIHQMNRLNHQFMCLRFLPKGTKNTTE